MNHAMELIDYLSAKESMEAEDFVGSFPNRDGFISEFDKHSDAILTDFKTSLLNLTKKDQTRILSRMLDFFFENHVDERGKRQTLVLLDKLNRRLHPYHGGGLGEKSGKWLDIVATLAGSTAGHSFRPGRSSKWYPLVAREVLAHTPHRRKQLTGNHSTRQIKGFIPSPKVPELEANVFLNLSLSGSKVIFPFFDKRLQPLFQGIGTFSRHYMILELDSVAALLCRMIGYRGTNDLSIILDYKDVRILASYDPKVEEFSTPSGQIGWQTSTPLGCCSYLYTPQGRSGIAEVEVTLFMSNILRASSDLGLDPNWLMMVVYIHELAHATYLSGTPLLGSQFCPLQEDRSFDISLFGDAQFHETIAQFLTFLLCKKDDELMNTFLKLNNYQSDVYHEWRQLKDVSPSDFSDRLVKINLGKNTRELKNLL